MEKIKFADLNLNKDNNIETKIIKINEHDIEVKRFLDINTKFKFAEYVMNKILSENDKYFNIIKLRYYCDLAFIQFFTNIDISDYSDEELIKVYDTLQNNDILDTLKDAVYYDDFYIIQNGLKEMIQHYFGYKNSVYGILDTVSTEYENLNLDMSKLKENMVDEDNLTLLKDVVTKLG